MKKKKARGGEMVPSQQSDHIEARLSSWIGEDSKDAIICYSRTSKAVPVPGYQ